MKNTGLGRRRAFTLVEMLVVVGITTVLIAMLMPAVANARKQAVTTACASQMRQLYLAVMAYANDNRGYFPKPPPLKGQMGFEHFGLQSRSKAPYYAWTMTSPGIANFESGTLVPYMGPNVASRERLMKCPADNGFASYTWYDNTKVSGPHNFSYGFNAFMNFQYTDGPAQKMTKVRNPALKILAWELRSPYDALVCFCGGNSLDTPSDRHFGRGNQTFVDGHVELLWPANVMATAHYFQFTNNQADCGSHSSK